MSQRPPLTQEQKIKFITDYKQMIENLSDDFKELKQLSRGEEIVFVLDKPKFTNGTNKKLPPILTDQFNKMIIKLENRSYGDDN